MKKSIIALIAAASLVRIICLAMFGVYLYVQWFHYTFIVNAKYVEYSESNDDFVLKTKEVVYDDGLRAVTFLSRILTENAFTNAAMHGDCGISKECIFRPVQITSLLNQVTSGR